MKNFLDLNTITKVDIGNKLEQLIVWTLYVVIYGDAIILVILLLKNLW